MDMDSKTGIDSENQSESPRIWRQEVEIDCILRTEEKIKHMMATTGENHWVNPYSKKRNLFLKATKFLCMVEK